MAGGGRLGVHHQRGGDVRPEEHEHHRAEVSLTGMTPRYSHVRTGANVSQLKILVLCVDDSDETAGHDLPLPVARR